MIINVVAFTSFGNIEAKIDGAEIKIKLTEEEAQRFIRLAEQVYTERQPRMVNEMAKPLPALIAPAEFEEVSGDF